MSLRFIPAKEGALKQVVFNFLALKDTYLVITNRLT